MDKYEVARILSEIGTLLEIQGENPFRCQAYHNGARALEQMEQNLDEVIAQGKLSEIRGIGETLRDKITALVQDGSLSMHEELRKKTPPGLFDVLKIQGMGPKKVKALYEELGIDGLDKLRLACQEGKVAGLKGFGAKTQQKILDGIEFLGKVGERVRIDQALEVAEILLNNLEGAPEIERMELCGSLRRRKDTIKDIDILICSRNAGPIMERFVNTPGVLQVTGHGDTKSSVVVDRDLGGGRRIALNADLRVVPPESFAFALNYFTGSKEHNVAMRARAQALGLRLNEYELAGDGKKIKCKEEADIYKALGLEYIPPELRELSGELEAAEEKRVPKLVENSDLQGTFHCHSTWSDGTASIEEMATEARRLGFKYYGVGDHSQSLTIANGLTPNRVREQQAEIDALNKKLKGIKIFKGTECDILPDGQLDFDDETLDSFDYVVASVHSHFNQTQEEMTRRIVRALSHPKVTILGHATGRLLLRREGYKVDLEAVLQTAAKHGKLIEINAHPQRLDIDWIHCKRAKALGVKLVINPDAHAPHEVGYTRFGVDVARRGWLEKSDVFNTLSLSEITRYFASKKSKS